MVLLNILYNMFHAQSSWFTLNEPAWGRPRGSDRFARRWATLSYCARRSAGELVRRRQPRVRPSRIPPWQLALLYPDDRLLAAFVVYAVYLGQVGYGTLGTACPLFSGSLIRELCAV